MSEKPINPLRRRMIEDMTVCNFVARQLQSSQSGSTLHEPAQAASPQIRSLASLVVGRPRQHSLQ